MVCPQAYESTVLVRWPRVPPPWPDEASRMGGDSHFVKTCLGDPSFHEIAINAPVVPMHNSQRDGFHRQTINRGRVNYESDSLACGCPFREAVADGIGLSDVLPAPMARPKVDAPEVASSPALSLFARPGETGIRGRRVAIVVADGIDRGDLLAIQKRLAARHFHSAASGPWYDGITCDRNYASDALALSSSIRSSAIERLY